MRDCCSVKSCLISGHDRNADKLQPSVEKWACHDTDVTSTEHTWQDTQATVQTHVQSARDLLDPDGASKTWMRATHQPVGNWEDDLQRHRINRKYHCSRCSSCCDWEPANSFGMFGLGCLLCDWAGSQSACTCFTCLASSFHQPHGIRESSGCEVIRARVAETVLVGDAVDWEETCHLSSDSWSLRLKSVPRTAEALNNPESAAEACSYPRACSHTWLRRTWSTCDLAPCPNYFASCIDESGIFWSLQTRAGAEIVQRVEAWTRTYSAVLCVKLVR